MIEQITDCQGHDFSIAFDSDRTRRNPCCRRHGVTVWLAFTTTRVSRFRSPAQHCDLHRSKPGPMQDHLRFPRGVANCFTEILLKVFHKNMHQNESQGFNREYKRKTWQTNLLNFRQGRLSCHSLACSLDGESPHDGECPLDCECPLNCDDSVDCHS